MTAAPSILAILFPVFATIILGLGLRRSGFPGDKFWQPAESLTYYVLFPALLVHKIAGGESAGNDIFPLLASLAAVIFTVTVLLLMFRVKVSPKGAAFTSLYQGVVRFNSYIGLSIVLALYGDRGILQAAILLAFLIPLVNVLCVLMLVRFGKAQSGQQSLALFIKAVARNPVVLACFVGIVLNNADTPLPLFVTNLLDILGKAALPLGLLTVGASLELKAIKGNALILSVASALKLLVVPGLMWLFCQLFAASQFATEVAIIFGALPGSALSFILAKQLGGDGKLMAQIVTVQTGLALISLPIILALLPAL